MALGQTLAGLFGRSPIKPLQTHFTIIDECVCKLIPFFEAVFSANWEEAARLQGEISRLEGDADDIKKSIRLQAHKRLFLPMPRTDLLELIEIQDRVPNKAKDIAGLILGRKMIFPQALQTSVLEFVTTSVDVTRHAQKAIDELDDLVQTGFGGREARLVENMVEVIDKLEHQTDQQQIAIRARLYEEEKELPPVDVMFLYKIIELIGELADRAEKVGGIVLILIAR